MKKILSAIIGVFITVIMMNMGVFAESMPIKKIEGPYVLWGNGTLVKKDKSILNKNTKYEVVSKDVTDFRAVYMGSYYKLAYLLNDGTLKYDGNKIVDTNVKQMLNEEFYLKNGTAYHKQCGVGKTYEYNNIKKLLMQSKKDYFYVLDNNDTMYACQRGKMVKIADDVLEFDTDRELIFNKNNEILSFDLDMNNGTTQLNLLTNQVSHENFCAGNLVTYDNKMIKYSKDKATILKDFTNVKSVVGFYDSWLKYLSLDNQIIYHSNSLGTSVMYDGKLFKYAFGHYEIDIDNNFYYAGKIIDTNVDKVLFYVGNRVIYQKYDNEIYCYGGDVYYSGLYKPFLYPLAQKQNKVIFNGKEIELEDNIQMRDGRSMYPFRAILEAMGASVMWDGTNQKAIGTLNGNRVEFKIGTNEYIVNGEIRYMDTQSYVDDLTDRTYIPIRYVAEALGFRVDWKQGDIENIITINK